MDIFHGLTGGVGGTNEKKLGTRLCAQKFSWFRVKVNSGGLIFCNSSEFGENLLGYLKIKKKIEGFPLNFMMNTKKNNNEVIWTGK